jgi:hypothetical protein
LLYKHLFLANAVKKTFIMKFEWLLAAHLTLALCPGPDPSGAVSGFYHADT